jgi:hypothetical protein
MTQIERGKIMNRILAIAAACTVSVLGQTTIVNKDVAGGKAMVIEMGDVAAFGPIGITAAMAGPMATVAGAPYSAQTETQRVQTLADGNRIEQSTSGNVARDSKGRVRREESLPALKSEAGNAGHLVRIEDPVAGVHWTLDAQRKIAIKMPFAQVKAQTKSVAPGAVVPPPPPGPGQVFFSSSTAPAGVQVVSKFQTSLDPDAVKTDLGTQTVEGVAAHGTQLTRTIPAGRIGNEQPIRITTETWYSPDLKVLVMSKTNDPRMGETTYRLTNIQRSEPPASLFQVPDDYTIKDQPENVFFNRVIKKDE